METFQRFFDEFKIHGQDLGAKIKELIHEGNVRRIIVKDEQGHTFMEIPLTIATVGVIAAPVLAAIGALASVVAKFTLVVERNPRGESGGGERSPANPKPDARV